MMWVQDLKFSAPPEPFARIRSLGIQGMSGVYNLCSDNLRSRSAPFETGGETELTLPTCLIVMC